MAIKFLAYAIIFSAFSLPSFSMDPPPESPKKGNPGLVRRLTQTFLQSPFPSGPETPKHRAETPRDENIPKTPKTLPQKSKRERARNQETLIFFSQQSKKLHDAIREGDVAEVEALLLSNKTLSMTPFCPINCQRYDDPFYKYPLFMAIKEGQLDIVILLLEYEVDVNYENIFTQSATRAKLRQSCLAAVFNNARSNDQRWHFIAALLVVKNAKLRSEELEEYGAFYTAIEEVIIYPFLKLERQKSWQELSKETYNAISKKIIDTLRPPSQDEVSNGKETYNASKKIRDTLRPPSQEEESDESSDMVPPPSLLVAIQRCDLHHIEFLLKYGVVDNLDLSSCLAAVFKKAVIYEDVRVYENDELHEIWFSIIEKLIKKGALLQQEEMKQYGKYYRYHINFMAVRAHLEGQMEVQKILDELEAQPNEQEQTIGAIN